MSTQHPATKRLRVFDPKQVSDPADITLRQFYEQHFCTTLDRVTEQQRGDYERLLDYWEVLTCNPTLSKLDGDFDGVDDFAEILSVQRSAKGVPIKVRGRQDADKGERPVSPRTVRKYLQLLAALLIYAGPRCLTTSRRSRRAKGLVEAPPLPELPIVPQTEPDWIFSPGEFAKLFAARVEMTEPGTDPAWWWGSVLLTGYFLSLRRTSLFQLRFDMIDWDRRDISVPAELMKRGTPFRFDLDDRLLDWWRDGWERRGKPAGLIHDWPTPANVVTRIRRIHDLFTDLHQLAGVQKIEGRAFHGLRKLSITAAVIHGSLSAAAVRAHHAGDQITLQRYVGRREAEEQLLGMPSPVDDLLGRRPSGGRDD